ncbi:response regulator [Desulfacinum hydrothermale]|uniref:response regulator n=1 Tax=Desulfacinum hydrothermale TaxID=109258 RepID=UPI0014825E0F|nr:response regulator [Desulfacinum hydrothermale]
MWISQPEARDHVVEILTRCGYGTRNVDTEGDLFQGLSESKRGIVFLDSGIIHHYGPTLYGRIQRACSGCRMIVLCRRDSRPLIREAMEAGVYGCVVEPYAPWEIETMVRHILADFPQDSSPTVSSKLSDKNAERPS